MEFGSGFAEGLKELLSLSAAGEDSDMILRQLHRGSVLTLAAVLLASLSPLIFAKSKSPGSGTSDFRLVDAYKLVMCAGPCV